MFLYKKRDSVKHRKFNIKGSCFSNKKLSFGYYGLKSLETGRISKDLILTCLTAMRRKLKPLGGKIWLRLNPCISVTKKPISIRMGKGKGSIDRHVSFVRKGQVMFEISVSDKIVALEALRLCSFKLPVKTMIIKY